MYAFRTLEEPTRGESLQQGAMFRNVLASHGGPGQNVGLDLSLHRQQGRLVAPP
jgi:hypothetical protein